MNRITYDNDFNCIGCGIVLCDVVTMLKAHDNCENCAVAIEDRQPPIDWCRNCKYSEPWYEDEWIDVFNDG